MKLLLDFLPIVVFFAVYKWSGDLILATAILIPATLLQMAYTWFTRRTLEKMQLATLVLVILLGGATVVMGDGQFIMWKPTVVNGLFAVVFLLSQFIGAKPIVQRMMDSKITLPDRIWHRLNFAWVIFFVLLGLVNIYVAFNFSENTWVNFKLFGMLGLTLLFVVLQGFYIARHVQLNSQD